MNRAAVDIGTNSVRVLIADPFGREIERAMRITRLGQGVDVGGELQPAAIARTVEVLNDFGARIRAANAERVLAVATSAARDARNRELFFDAAERALGARPRLLSGEDEARFSFQGATAELARSAGPFLVVDIGGGSTELVLGAREPEESISVQLGCVRMTERHLKSDPPEREEIARAVADVERELARVRRTIHVTRARRVIGLAGTVTALAALDLGLDRYDASRTHHHVLRREIVETLFERLAAADVERRRTLLAEPARAEAVVGGALVLRTLLREFAIEELLVSEHDILDGLVASLR